MFNLLRMDLRRLFKTRSFYIILGDFKSGIGHRAHPVQIGGQQNQHASQKGNDAAVNSGGQRLGQIPGLAAPGAISSLLRGKGRLYAAERHYPGVDGPDLHRRLGGQSFFHDAQIFCLPLRILLQKLQIAHSPGHWGSPLCGS